MPYLGNIPAEAFSSFDKQTITGNGGASYTLTHPVGSAQEVAIFVNNVRQEPGVAYTVTGTALTMTGNVASTDDFYAIFIGKARLSANPADNTVTAAMLQSDSVTTAKIAGENVTTAKVAANAITVAKLASTLDLSSNTVTLNKNASALVHLASIDASPSASTYEWTMDYDDYSEFVLQIQQITGSSSSGSENLDVKFKINGTLDDGLGAPYNADNINLGTGTHRNINNTDNMEWFTTNTPNKEWRGTIHCVNFDGGGPPLMSGNLGGSTTNNLASFYSSNGFENAGKQVTAMRIAFTAGNVDTVKLRVYGVKK